jgi:hypothetical protein
MSWQQTVFGLEPMIDYQKEKFIRPSFLLPHTSNLRPHPQAVNGGSKEKRHSAYGGEHHVPIGHVPMVMHITPSPSGKTNQRRKNECPTTHPSRFHLFSPIIWKHDIQHVPDIPPDIPPARDEIRNQQGPPHGQ